MEEKKIKAACNLCVLIIVIGILMCVLADSRHDVYNAFLLMAIGAAGSIIFGYVWENIRPLPLRDWSREDIEEAKYMYRGEYPFRIYLLHNGSSMEELVGFLDDTPDPELLLNTVYLDYEETAGEDITQTLEQVKAMIERERRKRDGRIKATLLQPKES